MERGRKNFVLTRKPTGHRSYGKADQADEMLQKTFQWTEQDERFCPWTHRLSEFGQPGLSLDEPSVRELKQRILQTWSSYLALAIFSRPTKPATWQWMEEPRTTLPVFQAEMSQRMRQIEDRCALLEKTIASVLERIVEIEGILEQQRTVPTKEQRRKRLDVLFERAMEAAVEIEERYGDPVELLTTLLPLSEEEARKLERE